MSIPQITGVELAGDAGLPLLVVGPSLGTTVTTLWGHVAERLGHEFHVVGWNLPGHDNAPVGEPFTMSELAHGVLAYIDRARAARGDDRPFAYAGDSVGGAVGLQLLLDAPAAVTGAVLLCTGARIGTPQAWAERAATVRASGTGAVVGGSAQRWFAPGFLDRSPEVASALLHALELADREGYSQVCDALAAFDVRDRLGEVTAPVLAVAGAHDAVTPTTALSEIATGMTHGRLVVLGDVAHLAPAEAPDGVAALLRGQLVASPTLQDVYEAGMVVRREVLGETHVDRATAAATSLTQEFQTLITQYAWGTIWTRPGLARRDRSIAVLTALIARGHHEELEMHVRAAVRNGLTVAEIKEVILQTAIYCGVPDANTAFRIAQQVFDEDL
ncbi:MAG: 4-carboxymuconolactone decarboxylase / 3-oxoadipate enol-lactonase [Nocardioides sp.]|nr:4-carboxymuconolactone decarboxylase [Nocardioides sp.]MCW2835017.1 4-carboxymuconolactone decarboxylase / 3-oxoadipate enol-lactonase [Nocardioides sp.]